MTLYDQELETSWGPSKSNTRLSLSTAEASSVVITEGMTMHPPRRMCGDIWL